jgi:hypothetical protein
MVRFWKNEAHWRSVAEALYRKPAGRRPYDVVVLKSEGFEFCQRLL